jgi:hypothetical protein
MSYLMIQNYIKLGMVELPLNSTYSEGRVKRMASLRPAREKSLRTYFKTKIQTKVLEV